VCAFGGNDGNDDDDDDDDDKVRDGGLEVRSCCLVYDWLAGRVVGIGLLN
jgi:hypothetical protein